jgi:hypothetical protein
MEREDTTLRGMPRVLEEAAWVVAIYYLAGVLFIGTFLYAS